MARQPIVPEIVRQFLAMIQPPPNGLVVAVSGGADSVALLRALIEIQPGPLIVAHFNHGLRGAESAADSQFVADLAKLHRLPCREERWSYRVPGNGENLESAARDARYQWLASVASDEKIQFVATGHSADDQAETVLFHILRGTGLAGLRGIAPRRSLTDQIEVIRPLLAVQRERVEAYLNSLGQAWRQDSSNLDPRFTRNRIRRDLLPLLARQYNPRVAEALARLGREATAWRRAQVSGVARRLQDAELPKAGHLVVLDRSKIEALARHTLRVLWSAIWQREGWPRQEMGYEDFQRIARWCRSSSAALKLPGGIRLARKERTIVAGPARSTS